MQHRSVSPVMGGGRSCVWKRRFRTSVVVTRESRKFLSSQQTDDNGTSTWSVSIYLFLYSSFWRGLTALSILCDEGNARAYESRMGREQHLRLFCILRRTKNINFLLGVSTKQKSFVKKQKS